MTQPRLAIVACALAALVLTGGCGKKEEKTPAAAQPQQEEKTPAAAQPQPAAKLIDEAKRNAVALNAQQAGTAALPYSQLPGLLDQLASHMEARAQARQQGADTSRADTQITSDVTRLQEIQNTMSASQPEGDKKPALDQLSENLTKVIQIVRQAQELKATLKPPLGDSSTGSGDTTVAAAAVSTPAATSQEAAATPPAQTQTAVAEQSQPPAAPAPEISPGSCCSVVPNPTMKGRLGRLIVTYPEGANANARIDVYRGNEAATAGHGNQAFALLPGSYTVVISGKRVDNVTVQSGHDTQVKVGVLRVTAPGGTRIDVLDQDGKTPLTAGHGNKQFGFPIGQVSVRVAGQSEPVTIKDGQITDF